MKAVVISFTSSGLQLSQEAAQICILHGCEARVFSAKGENAALPDGVTPVRGTLREWTGKAFLENDLLVFIGACGIAVRCIAPFVKDKLSDPAVVVIDDRGKNAISLLSGHAGGANRWADILAAGIGARAVVTTSSDNHGRLAVDLFALENGLAIADRDAAKKLEAAILDEEPVGVIMDKNITVEGQLPEHFYITQNFCEFRHNMIISIYRHRPFDWRKGGGVDLHLIPGTVTLGVGCRKGKGREEIDAFVKGVLEQENISEYALCGISTIDLKKEEAGILEFAGRYGLPVSFLDAAALNSVRGDFNASDFVRQITGTDNVCERAALFCEAGEEKELAVRKQAGNGITVAAAVRKLAVCFSGAWDSSWRENI